jgi:hypothetical protein
VQGQLADQSLDVVHFICHGGLVSNQPYLAVTDCPVCSNSRSSAQYLSVGETSAFLTQCGAWAAFFSAPPFNYSPCGLRYFADLLSQTRPGAVLMHDMGRSDWAEGLGETYRFFFSQTPQHFPPRPDVSICCQPGLVLREVALPKELGIGDALQKIVRSNDSLLGMSLGGPTVATQSGAGAADLNLGAAVPGWLSASQRFVEGVAYGIQPHSNFGTPSAGSDANAKVLFDTLQQIQNVVKGVATDLYSQARASAAPEITKDKSL